MRGNFLRWQKLRAAVVSPHNLLLQLPAAAMMCCHPHATTLPSSPFAAGCQGQCSDQFPDVVMASGFKGVTSLPRQLTYDLITKTARMYPVAEITTLRGAQVGRSGAVGASRGG
jgi:hypothetical protein